MLNAFAVVANILFTVFSLVCSVYYFIADNWSWISPIIYGIGAALLFYLAATKGVALAQTIGTAITGAYTAATTFLKIGYGVLTGNTAAASAAQFVYNSALLACPLTWILLIIIAVNGARCLLAGKLVKLGVKLFLGVAVVVNMDISSASGFGNLLAQIAEEENWPELPFIKTDHDKQLLDYIPKQMAKVDEFFLDVSNMRR